MGALYVATILATIGSFAQLPPRAAWSTSNIGGHTKRAVGIATISNFGNIGGAIAGQIYPDSDAPHYIRGHSVCLGMMAGVAIMCLVLKFILWKINKKRESLTPEEYEKACQGEHLCDYVSLLLLYIQSNPVLIATLSKSPASRLSIHLVKYL